MQAKLVNLSVDDGRDIFEMLQELPSDENGQSGWRSKMAV